MQIYDLNTIYLHINMHITCMYIISISYRKFYLLKINLLINFIFG